MMRESGRLLAVMAFAFLLVWVLGFDPGLAWLLLLVAVSGLAAWGFTLLHDADTGEADSSAADRWGSVQR